MSPTVAGIDAPVPILHMEARDLIEASSSALFPPYFLVVWDAEHVIGVWRHFSRCGPPLDWESVLAAVAGRSPAKSAPRPDQPVSLIICTRDRPDMLEKCLVSLRDQSIRPAQTIVVDNASQSEATRYAAERHGVACVREERPGLSYARNTGIALAVHEMIAFTDDDTVLHPRWLERLAAAFDAPQIWAATGLVLPTTLESTAQCVFERYWGFGRGFVGRDFDHSYYLATRSRGTPVWHIGAGANMAARRSAIERVGGFEPRLGSGPAGCGDDSELWYRILHAGGICRYEPGAIVSHSHRADPAGLRKQIRSYMCGHAAALMVQYERTGDRGNLRRLFMALPRNYLRKAAHRVVRGQDGSTCLLTEEVAGVFAGVAHYLRSPRAPSPTIDRVPIGGSG
jgi:GT2 family glycosyltransferase